LGLRIADILTPEINPFLNSLILRLKCFINISWHIGFVLIKEIIAVNDNS